MHPGATQNSSLERVGSFLRRHHAELIVSKRTLEKAKGVELVRIKREQAAQSLCFCSRPFVLCGLPVRRLPPDQLLYQRRNGQFLLQITGHPDYGVPFGQDRIVPIFLATLAVQQKSPVIRSEVLRRCSKSSACTRAAKNTGVWSGLSSGYSARPSSLARIRLAQVRN